MGWKAQLERDDTVCREGAVCSRVPGVLGDALGSGDLRLWGRVT